VNQEQKPITLKQAAGRAGVSPDTVARWCKRYGIGKQLHPKAPWRVDPEALRLVASGDAEALKRYYKACAAKTFDLTSENLVSPIRAGVPGLQPIKDMY
jgi:hypothetical protein